MTVYGGMHEEPGLLIELWAAVCQVTGWRCRCPKCGGKMRRELAVEESFQRRKGTRIVAPSTRMTGQYDTLKASRSPYIQLRVTPIYDTCTVCGHRIRRRNVKTAVG